MNQNSKKRKELKKQTKTKNNDRIRSLWDISKHTNIRIIGMPGEEEEKEIENLFEKTMKAFHEDGAQSKEGSPCPSQSQSQGKGFEGKASSAKRHPQPQKKEDPQVTHLQEA